MPSAPAYFLKRLATEIVKDPDTGCWVWQGGKTTAGYGSIRFNRRAHFTHRIAYEHAKGPIPQGLQIDHLCRQRDCINPDHLECVTHAENLKRARQSHCLRGHALTDDNVYVSPGNQRQCRKCRRMRCAALREKRRG